MNIRRWVVHIGAAKTGSTAIQRCLSDNRDALLQQGLVYPDVSLRGWGHHDLAFLLDGGYPDWAIPQPRPLTALILDLRAAVARADVPCIVLSSENFYLYPRPAGLRAVLQAAGLQAQDRITIVCYLRRQDEAQMSWYNQTVKAQGYSGSFESSLRQHHGLWDYAQRLRPWQAEFGSDALAVRVYDPVRQPDVCSDFLSILGVEAARLRSPIGRANERINRDILELQRLVNRLPLKVTSKRRHHKQLIALTAAAALEGIFDDRPFLTPAAAGRLMQSYDEGNLWVARTFLGRETLFDPLSEAAPNARANSTPAGWTLAKIRYTWQWFRMQQDAVIPPRASN